MTFKNLGYTLFSVIIILQSCSSDKSNKKYRAPEFGDTYEDGKYCAEVIYYNQNTNSKKTWTLPIIIEDGRLIEIQFNNGGWLDESHFTPPELNSDDLFEFTDDRGYDFIVGVLYDEYCEN